MATDRTQSIDPITHHTYIYIYTHLTPPNIANRIGRLCCSARSTPFIIDTSTFCFPVFFGHPKIFFCLDAQEKSHTRQGVAKKRMIHTCSIVVLLLHVLLLTIFFWVTVTEQIKHTKVAKSRRSPFGTCT